MRKIFRWLNINPKWAGISFACATIIGLLNFSAVYSVNRSYGHDIQVLARLYDELTGTWSLVMLLPFLLGLFRSWPLIRSKLVTRIGGYLVAMILMGFLHTMIMTVVRGMTYPLLGFGAYNPGDLVFRTVMETAKAAPAFWFIYLGYVVYVRNREKQREAIRLVSLQKELAESRLNALRSQLDPHFFFNSLNMISSVMFEDVSKADKLIADLSEFLRYTLSLNDVQLVSVAKEMEITRKYLEIMQTRFDEQLQVKIDQEQTVKDLPIPVLCLQPLVENAIKFTLSDEVRQGRIAIAVQKREDKLVISVSDNGPGLSANGSGTQKGLQNTRERIRTIYGDSASLELRSVSTGGTNAILTIPQSPNLKK